MEITLQLLFVLVCQFSVSFSTSELRYKCFSHNDIFFMTLGQRFFVVRLHYVLRFVFVCRFVVFFTTSQLHYLCNRCCYAFL